MKTNLTDRKLATVFQGQVTVERNDGFALTLPVKVHLSPERRWNFNALFLISWVDERGRCKVKEKSPIVAPSKVPELEPNEAHIAEAVLDGISTFWQFCYSIGVRLVRMGNVTWEQWVPRYGEAAEATRKGRAFKSAVFNEWFRRQDDEGYQSRDSGAQQGR